MPRTVRVLDKLTTEYLKSQVETGNPARTKKALQQICKFYRDGFIIRHDQLVGMEQSIVGLLSTSSDVKVRRWALNALARLGREATCANAILHTAEQYSNDPETSAAAVAAIYRLSSNAEDLLKRFGFNEQMVTLAALQHVGADKLNLSPLPINTENARPEILKLALIVVGLNRAPPNMMHPRLTNGELVKALGKHHDGIVSQYTVWAITENSTLSLQDLGIDVRDVEQQPSNVRAWIFRLIAMNAEDAERNYEYIQLGTRDPSEDARAGLATGLKEIYFDGLETLVLDWFVNEGSSEVRELILEHLVRQASYCPSYEDLVLDIYEKEHEGSSLRTRIEVAAIKTRIYPKLKLISMDGSADLFKGTVFVNNTYNVGNIQGGAVSIGGDAKNSGETQFNYSPQTFEQAQAELAKAEKELNAAEIPDELKAEALQAIETAKADPTRDKISAVVGVLGKVNTFLARASGAVTSIGIICGTLAKLYGLF